MFLRNQWVRHILSVAVTILGILLPAGCDITVPDSLPSTVTGNENPADTGDDVVVQEPGDGDADQPSGDAPPADDNSSDDSGDDNGAPADDVPTDSPDGDTPPGTEDPPADDDPAPPDDDPPPDEDDPPPDDGEPPADDDPPPDDEEPPADPDVPSNEYCDPVSDWDLEWVDFEEEVLALVNQHRASGADCGSQGSFDPAGPLTMLPALRCAARAHSMDMNVRGFFSHTNPDGHGPGQRLDLAGYQGFTWGENIAWGYPSPAAVVAGWMGSDGHCANIMRPQFNAIGVGYYEGNYWTQAFGAE